MLHSKLPWPRCLFDICLLSQFSWVTGNFVQCFGAHQNVIKVLIRVVVLPKTWGLLLSSHVVRIYFLAAVEFMRACLFKANIRDMFCLNLCLQRSMPSFRIISSQSHPEYCLIWLTEIKWIEIWIISAKSFCFCCIMWVTSHTLSIFYWLEVGYRSFPHQVEGSSPRVWFIGGHPMVCLPHFLTDSFFFLWGKQEAKSAKDWILEGGIQSIKKRKTLKIVTWKRRRDRDQILYTARQPWHWSWI